jgi:membrane protease YdiL (CAAX protease family)
MEQRQSALKIFQLISLAAFFILALAVEGFGLAFSEDALMSRIIGVTLTGILGGAFALLIAAEYKFDILSFKGRDFFKSLLKILPFIIVTVNNLPVYALASGAARVTYPFKYGAAFFLSCLAVGFLEEMLFRGVILLLIFKKFNGSALKIFYGIVLSSAVFALSHIFNLAAGAGVGETLLQIGYTFLTGCMWSLVLIITRNIWVCAALHGLYNFFGQLVPVLGRGTLWDTPTIILTAAIALIAAVYFLYTVSELKPQSIEKLGVKVML